MLHSKLQTTFFDILNLSVSDEPGKMFITAIKCFLGVVRKYTGRQLAHFDMILNTLAAYSFSRTRLIAAVAVF